MARPISWSLAFSHKHSGWACVAGECAFVVFPNLHHGHVHLHSRRGRANEAFGPDDYHSCQPVWLCCCLARSRHLNLTRNCPRSHRRTIRQQREACGRCSKLLTISCPFLHCRLHPRPIECAAVLLALHAGAGRQKGQTGAAQAVAGPRWSCYRHQTWECVKLLFARKSYWMCLCKLERPGQRKKNRTRTYVRRNNGRGRLCEWNVTGNVFAINSRRVAVK